MRSLSLRTRTLALAITAALTPLGLLAVGVLAELRSNLVAEAQADHAAIVGNLLQTIDGDLESLDRQVSSLAQDPRLQSLKPDRVHDALRNFLSFNDTFYSLFVYDRDTALRFVEFRTHNVPADIVLGKRAREFGPKFAAALDQVMATGKGTSFDYLRHETAQSQLLLMEPIEPFVGEGPRIGVISCAIQMYSHQFQDLLDAIQLEGSTYCLILDRKGRVLARKGVGLPPDVVSVKIPSAIAPPSAPPTQESPDTAAIVTRRMDVGGRVDLVTVAPVPLLRSTIVVGRPDSEVLALLGRMTDRIAMIALLGLILAAAGALALSRSLLGPILELTEGIRRVGEGAIGHRVRIEGAQELVKAGQAFNRMAAHLQKGRLLEQIWARTWTDEPR